VLTDAAYLGCGQGAAASFLRLVWSTLKIAASTPAGTGHAVLVGLAVLQW
jgi:hypothetical protein